MDDGVDEILVVETATVVKLFGVTIEGFEVVVKLFGKSIVEEDDTFMVKRDFFVVDVGALSTRRR